MSFHNSVETVIGTQDVALTSDFTAVATVQLFEISAVDLMHIHTYILYCIVPPWGLFHHT